MKYTKNTLNWLKVFMAVYALFIVWVVYDSLAKGKPADAGIVTAVSVVVFIYLTRILKRDSLSLKKGLTTTDEFSRTVSLMADAKSYWISYVIVAALLVYNEFFAKVQMTSSTSLSIVLVTMAVSMIFANIYFEKKGV